MSEPSMETVEKARAILDTSGDYLDRLELIAVALQQLMDERDAWQGTVDQLNSTCALWTKRAEAAEAALLECEGAKLRVETRLLVLASELRHARGMLNDEKEILREVTQRAEAAEARVKELMDERAAAGEVAHSWMVETLAATKRAEAAEAKLRDVYEGNEPNPIHAAEALQAAAEAKLAELVRRVREWRNAISWPELEAILAEYEPKPGEPEP